MKKAKYLCKIGYKNISEPTIVDVDFYTSKVSDVVEYAKQVKDGSTYPYRLNVIDNTNGELLISMGYDTNNFYICSSAYKLASKIFKNMR